VPVCLPLPFRVGGGATGGACGGHAPSRAGDPALRHIGWAWRCVTPAGPGVASYRLGLLRSSACRHLEGGRGVARTPQKCAPHLPHTYIPYPFLSLWLMCYQKMRIPTHLRPNKLILSLVDTQDKNSILCYHLYDVVPKVSTYSLVTLLVT